MNRPMAEPPRLERSFAWCERLTRQSAANFYPAFLVLPRPQRRAMCALYAFLRVSDDLADEPGPIADRRAALAEWRHGMDLALTHGTCSHPLHAAFRHTVHRHGIPREYLEAVLDGVESDLGPIAIADFAELSRYCWRVASAVGLACLHVWGFIDERAKGHAEQAGLAFQLTNILRDLGEDRARGRCYLPRDELERFDCLPEAWGDGRSEAFRALMRFQVARARSYYDAASPLAGMLRPAGRAVFQVMARTYRGLLDEIERCDFDVLRHRARLGRLRKLGLLLAAFPVRWGWA